MQVTRVASDRPVPSLMHRRRVMADRITYVGLDVHKESIVVAVASGGLRGEVREYGRSRTRRRRSTVCCASSATLAWFCGFATRLDRAVMAFNGTCRPGDTSASWLPPR